MNYIVLIGFSGPDCCFKKALYPTSTSFVLAMASVEANCPSLVCNFKVQGQCCCSAVMGGIRRTSYCHVHPFSEESAVFQSLLGANRYGLNNQPAQTGAGV